MGHDETRWAEVDAYLAETLIGTDSVLSEALEANVAADLPPIDVSAVQGKLLYLLARTARAVNVLEIGTLGGYSTIWLARAVGDRGNVVTLEADHHHAETARANLARAGVSDRVEIVVGAALDSLAVLPTPGESPFDFVFVDADKENNTHYVREAVRLGRPGTVIVVDNVVRGGGVTNAELDDAAVRASREVLQLFAEHPRLDASAIQTVGAKGWDGFAYALITE